FVMGEHRANTKGIPPLNIVSLNLMPERARTELQLLRLLGNTPIQGNITIRHTATHGSKTERTNHFNAFYSTCDEIKQYRYDGMITTGAPIEHLHFTDVNYWEELTEIMDWSNDHVTSVMHICWGAQAALYHHYGIGKHELPEK